MTYKFSNLKSSIHSTLYTLCTQHSTQTTQTTLLPTIHYTLYTIHYTLYTIHYTLGCVLGGGSVSHFVPRITASLRSGREIRYILGSYDTPPLRSRLNNESYARRTISWGLRDTPAPVKTKQQLKVSLINCMVWEGVNS